jgi:hypothetical protein
VLRANTPGEANIGDPIGNARAAAKCAADGGYLSDRCILAGVL